MVYAPIKRKRDYDAIEHPWIPVTAEKKPTEYDLVNVRYESGIEGCGWWTGRDWDCGRRLSDKPITHWQKIGSKGLMINT